MSRPVTVAWGETAEGLYDRYRRERDLPARKRLHALWLVRRGDGVASAAQQAGVGVRTLERWLGWYREGGLDMVLGRVPGHGAKGALGKLTAEQVGRLAQHAGSGEFYTYGEAAEWVRSEYGVGYSYTGIWSLLSRLEIHPKVPRPAAEQADAEAQEAYKNAPCILALPRVRFPVELYARPHEGGWAGRGEPETLRGARACDIDEVPLPTAARR